MKLTPDRKLYIATACVAVVLGALLWAAVMITRSAAAGAEDAGAALVVVWLFAAAMFFAALRPLVDLFVRAPAALAEETRIVVRDSGRRVKPVGCSEVQQLAEAINELAMRRQSLEEDVAAEIARAQASLEADRNRLAVLMAELRQSVVVFNLFGLIPWMPPHFLMIGAWPLIMGVTMFLQMKLNPTPTDPIQAKMFMIMPVVFTFMLGSFPAGLVIYWAWNNTLSIIQQWVIMRRMGAA